MSEEKKLIHVRLTEYDREALTFLKARYGGSWASAMRASVRAMASQLGFQSKNFPTNTARGYHTDTSGPYG